MKNLVWVGLCVIVLSLSFTLAQRNSSRDKPVQQVAVNTPPPTLIHGVTLEPIRTIVSHNNSSATALVEELQRVSASSRNLSTAPTGEHSSAPNHASADLDADTIDRLVSAPFNQIVKNNW